MVEMDDFDNLRGEVVSENHLIKLASLVNKIRSISMTGLQVEVGTIITNEEDGMSLVNIY